MTQPTLPFRHFRPLPALHALWFRMANAADYGADKHHWFYPFKDRLLARRGIPDGIDLQVIERRCWCGDGIFRGRDHTAPRIYWDICDRCGGTGIHRTDRVLLSRWILNGDTYHCPIRRLAEGEEYPGPVRDTVTGLVEHRHIPSATGRAAFSRLLLRYEPREWLKWQRWRLRQWWSAGFYHSTGLRRLLWNMQLEWRAINADADDIPF